MAIKIFATKKNLHTFLYRWTRFHGKYLLGQCQYVRTIKAQLGHDTGRIFYNQDYNI